MHQYPLEQGRCYVVLRAAKGASFGGGGLGALLVSRSGRIPLRRPTLPTVRLESQKKRVRGSCLPHTPGPMLGHRINWSPGGSAVQVPGESRTIPFIC